MARTYQPLILLVCCFALLAALGSSNTFAAAPEEQPAGVTETIAADEIAAGEIGHNFTGNDDSGDEPGGEGALGSYPGLWVCWDASNPNPCHNTLLASAVTGENEVWAVGQYGVILRWDGAAWQSLSSPTFRRLLSITMLSPEDGWAGGDQVILRWNGVTWSTFASPTTSIYAIKMFSSSDGLAASSQGLLRWDGITWSPLEEIPVKFFALDGVSPQDVWVSTGSSLQHWNGQSWSTAPETEGLNIAAIQMLSATSGWAVGAELLGDSTREDVFLRWDGSTWKRQDTPSIASPVRDVWMRSETDGWAAAANGIYHWDGNSWSQEVLLTAPDELHSIVFSQQGTGWAFGWSGLVLQKSETTWSPAISTSQAGYVPQDIDMLDSSDGWYVGWSDAAYHWNGESWQAVSIPDKDWNAVEMRNPRDGWAVGGSGAGGVIAHWDGREWNLALDGLPGALYGVSTLPNGQAWAVGKNGLILHWDGSVWTIVPSPTELSLSAVDMLSPNQGWAVGGREAGVILRWDGKEWSLVDSFPSEWKLLDIEMLSRSNGWAVGDRLVHWDGKEWSEVPLQKEASIPLFSIAFSGPGEGWITSGASLVWHWNGSSWTKMPGAFIPATAGGQVAVVKGKGSTGWLVSHDRKRPELMRLIPAQPNFLPILSRP